MTLDPIVLLALIVAVSIAALVNGMIGFGFALLAVIVIANVTGPKEAVIVMSLLAPLISGLQVIRHRTYAVTWRRFQSLLAGTVVGSVVGTQLLVVLPGPAISLALGAFTVYYVVTAIREERPPIGGATERRLAPLAGLVAGVTNATLGASGPVLGTYLVALGLRGREFAFAIGLCFFVMSILRVGMLFVLDQYAPVLITAALVLYVPSVLGQRLGFWLQGRISARKLHRAVLVVLLVASANLLWRGIGGLLPR